MSEPGKRKRGVSQSLVEWGTVAKRKVSGLLSRRSSKEEVMEESVARVPADKVTVDGPKTSIEVASQLNEGKSAQIEVPTTTAASEHDTVPSPASSMSSIGRIYDTSQLRARVNSTFEEIITPTWSSRPSTSPASSVLNLSSRASVSSLYSAPNSSAIFSSSHGSRASLISEAASDTSARLRAPDEPYVVEIDFFDANEPERGKDLDSGAEDEMNNKIGEAGVGTGSGHAQAQVESSTSTRRAGDALSARSMPKKPSTLESNFGVDVPILVNGKPIYGTDGKIQKERRSMADGVLPNGSPQPLYHPADHPDPALRGVFKGMAQILEERGYTDSHRLRAQCNKFQCPTPPNNIDPFTFYSANPCCCRRLLYHQPDFANVKSRLELQCEELAIGCLFVPKFHCELNPIEQCWGYAKRIYRKNPASKKEADLEINLVNALEAVPLKSIRRFYTRALRFADAYQKGLNGKQAAWASKKYSGHRVIPANIFESLTAADIV